jgi:hypothetical protein
MIRSILYMKAASSRLIKNTCQTAFDGRSIKNLIYYIKSLPDVRALLLRLSIVMNIIY